MAHHNKYYSVYQTGSGYKYEVTESFDDGDFVSISKELSEADLKSKCFPLLGSIYDVIGLNYSRFSETSKNAANFKNELSGSGITYDYLAWASSSYIDHYSGSFTVVSGSGSVTYDVASNSSVSQGGTIVGSIVMLSSRVFEYQSNLGFKEMYYSDDGVHYTDALGISPWAKI